MNSIAIIGPAYPLRGGIAAYNHRLAQQFIDEGNDCTIFSFSLQYPSFLFPGKTQYAEGPAPARLKILSTINSVNPLSWLKTGRAIADMKPGIVIVRYWIPFMAPALGVIVRQIKKRCDATVICIADNIVPHEKRPGDRMLTRYFIRHCDAFITMSQQVLDDLRLFSHRVPARLIPHPLYDHFGEEISKREARQKLGLDQNIKILLFFGFIRKYKGLDLLIEALANEHIRKEGIKLLVAGEFYDHENEYLQLIERLDLKDDIILYSDFIPDDMVRYYVCASDAIVQPYRSATQSGVTPLAYHFDKPMIVTDVGGLPDLVPHEKAGIVTLPDPESIAKGILRFYELGENFFIPHLRVLKMNYSWHQLVKGIKELAASVDTGL